MEGSFQGNNEKEKGERERENRERQRSGGKGALCPGAGTGSENANTIWTTDQGRESQNQACAQDINK